MKPQKIFYLFLKVDYLPVLTVRDEIVFTQLIAAEPACSRTIVRSPRIAVMVNREPKLLRPAFVASKIWNDFCQVAIYFS